MANGTLPSYLASARPNPAANRGPWYTNIGPSYFGIFMWVAFYDKLGGALQLGGLDAALGGLVIAAVLSHYLFYRVFAVLGMQTGLPLYVVGSSTFGTKGGLLFPGIFMGILQIGWYSVATFYSAKLLLGGLGVDAAYTRTLLDPKEAEQGFSMVFVLAAIAWGYIFASFGAFGIKYVAKVSTYMPWIAVAMLGIAAVCALPFVGQFKMPEGAVSTVGPLAAACLVIQMVIGFFATAGAAGGDFGTAARSKDDVNLGGLTGITLSIVMAGGLALIIVAGAQGVKSSEDFTVTGSLGVVSPDLARIMLLLLAIGSMAPACFCSSIIGNSLSTMIPSIGRVALTLGGATIGILLAATGVAGNLESFFGLIGASFGPICGAIVADYLLSGKKWAGPREGVNVPGYAAWVVGFLVGISNNDLVTKMLGGEGHEILSRWHPAAVYSFIVAFIVYAVLAKAGMQPRTVDYPQARQA